MKAHSQMSGHAFLKLIELGKREPFTCEESKFDQL